MSLGVAIALALLVSAPTSAPERTPPSQPLTITAVGDVIFGWYTAAGYTPLTAADVFDAVRPQLTSDLGLANLETPVARTLPVRSPLPRGWRFGARPEVLGWLHDAGFTALSIANNHAVDLAEDGLRQTAELVEAAGMTPLGRPSPMGAARTDTLEVNGWTVAVVAAATWLNAPVPGGHHPHVLQGVEWVGDTLVAYSLGNFVFRAREGTSSRESVVLRMTRSPGGRWAKVDLVPIFIDGTSRLQPRPATAIQTRSIRRALRGRSARYGTRTELADDGTLRVVVPTPPT